jgi:hypothetical protein
MTPGWCIDLKSFTTAAEAINSTHDFGMVALAVVMIRSLKLDKIKKWKLVAVFCLGGV